MPLKYTQEMQVKPAVYHEKSQMSTENIIKPIYQSHKQH
ncbi:hypothetical protein [Synechococcus phage S-H38]|uniref:Uncharacterized protein n=1 Tax=Synechococcus phage S-H38 TaxID=2783673 RepID=A0A873WGA2_9CAUD|nr:hypothetical protein PQC14_gp109 [Synechococcus phage S-H38]QPB07952.1 hypothetical protein [Synechococcus phage S-H38]